MNINNTKAYATLFDQLGPRKSLLYTTIFYSCIVGIIGIIIELIDPWLISNNNNNNATDDDYSTTITTSYVLQTLSRILVFIMFVMKNSFVHLFYTQHWSFISSIFHQQSKTTIKTSDQYHNVDDNDIKADDATTYFPIISGIASISATVCAYGMSQPIIQLIFYINNLPHRLLYISSIMNIVCAILADNAYSIAEKNNFVPSASDSKEQTKTSSKKTKITESKTILSTTVDGESDINRKKKDTLIHRAIILFRRVPILKGLCIEVLFCQAVSSVLCYLFVSTTKKVFILLDDKERSQFTGKVCYCLL